MSLLKCCVSKRGSKKTKGDIDDFDPFGPAETSSVEDKKVNISSSRSSLSAAESSDTDILGLNKTTDSSDAGLDGKSKPKADDSKDLKEKSVGEFFARESPDTVKEVRQLSAPIKMNGPQVTRERLPDGGEKITTVRQEVQPDGSIRTVTESKTVYENKQPLDPSKFLKNGDKYSPTLKIYFKNDKEFEKLKLDSSPKRYETKSKENSFRPTELKVGPVKPPRLIEEEKKMSQRAVAKPVMIPPPVSWRPSYPPVSPTTNFSSPTSPSAPTLPGVVPNESSKYKTTSTSESNKSITESSKSITESSTYKSGSYSDSYSSFKYNSPTELSSFKYGSPTESSSFKYGSSTESMKYGSPTETSTPLKGMYGSPVENSSSKGVYNTVIESSVAKGLYSPPRGISPMNQTVYRVSSPANKNISTPPRVVSPLGSDSYGSGSYKRYKSGKDASWVRDDASWITGSSDVFSDEASDITLSDMITPDQLAEATYLDDIPPVSRAKASYLEAIQPPPTSRNKAPPKVPPKRAPKPIVRFKLEPEVADMSSVNSYQEEDEFPPPPPLNEDFPPPPPPLDITEDSSYNAQGVSVKESVRRYELSQQMLTNSTAGYAAHQQMMEEMNGVPSLGSIIKANKPTKVVLRKAQVSNAAPASSTPKQAPSSGAGEPDEISSNDGSHLNESSHLNDSFTSDTMVMSPRSPGGSRLEDSLPEFVPPKRYVKPEEKMKPSQTPGVMIMGAGDSMCKVCGKRVYEMEKVIADKNVYHKMCFKCDHCKRVLSLTNFASMDGKLYCKPHFMELFKTKGNYDEGFGKERHVRQWTTPQREVTVQHDVIVENGGQEGLRAPGEEDQGQIEILKADEKVDDGIESVPSIRNLKSRFESKDATPPPVPADEKPTKRGTSPYGGSRSFEHAQQQQVGYSDYMASSQTTTQEEYTEHSSMTSESDMIEHTKISRTYRSPVSKSRPPSKWDKPKSAPPPPVNRQPEEGEEEPDELPPVGTSRSMAEKFKEYERGGGSAPSPDRPAVRRMTPPRDDLSSDIQHMQRDIERDPNIIRSGEAANTEEELPPAQYTKSLLEKFKSLEDTSSPAPTPVRANQIQSSAYTVKRTTVQTTHSQPVNRPSPDSGISDSEGHPANGGYADDQQTPDGGVSENNPQVLSDVLRESDRNDEVEMPEKGITRGLLAQWRNMEQTVQNQTGGSPSPPKPKIPSQFSNTSGYRTYSTTTTTQYRQNQDGTDGELEDRDLIRASDAAEEIMPSPAFTKNMRAKYQAMQDDAQREASNLKTPPPARKQFKWTVKEAKPLFVGKRTTSSSSYNTSPNGVHNESYDHIEYNEEGEYLEHEVGQHEEHYVEHHVEHNEDVVRADDTAQDDLPAPQTTRSMLAMFKSMEDVNRPPPTPQAQVQKSSSSVSRSLSINRGTVSSTSSQSRTINGHHSDHGSSHHSDAEYSSDGGYQQETTMELQYSQHQQDYNNQDYDDQGGEFENDPFRNPDVVREGDDNEYDARPEQGSTRHLMSKFQTLAV